MLNMKFTVPTLSALLALKNHKVGEVAYCTGTEKHYTWTGKVWKEIESTPSSNLKVNLYDLNKSILFNEKPLTLSEISEKLDLFMDFYHNTYNKNYMLLNNELKYYTVFQCDQTLSFPNFAEAVCDIIKNLGEILSIEKVSDNQAIEIWIRNDENVAVYYLFPYDQGVVNFG